MSNANGSYRSTRENTYRAFDKLPKSAREALAVAHHNWATQPVLTSFNRGEKPAQIVANISRWDADKDAKDRVKVWGKDYPTNTKAPGTIRKQRG